ncbi:SpoIIE family protein phosphatase, partial [Streptomyces sp. 4F14]|uniref:SpoIIE family protein phosphatase n=1 Tax=Streptomyces sp. 4F14 TaxID=3394380 RepID=UPI003A86ADD1
MPLSPGPPLGVGGMPFEITTFDLEPGSLLALYTKGLVRGEDHDIDAGGRRLREGLAAYGGADDSLQEVGRAVVAAVGDVPSREDSALLLARTRAVRTGNTAAWEFPADPTVVAEAREQSTRQLTAWGLD